MTVDSNLNFKINFTSFIMHNIKQIIVNLQDQKLTEIFLVKMAGGGGGKTDMERVGLFSEMGYTTLGDKYPKVHLSSSK